MHFTTLCYKQRKGLMHKFQIFYVFDFRRVEHNGLLIYCVWCAQTFMSGSYAQLCSGNSAGGVGGRSVAGRSTIGSH